MIVCLVHGPTWRPGSFVYQPAAPWDTFTYQGSFSLHFIPSQPAMATVYRYLVRTAPAGESFELTPSNAKRTNHPSSFGPSPSDSSVSPARFFPSNSPFLPSPITQKVSSGHEATRPIERQC